MVAQKDTPISGPDTEPGPGPGQTRSGPGPDQDRVLVKTSKKCGNSIQDDHSNLCTTQPDSLEFKVTVGL